MSIIFGYNTNWFSSLVFQKLHFGGKYPEIHKLSSPRQSLPEKPRISFESIVCVMCWRWDGGDLNGTSEPSDSGLFDNIPVFCLTFGMFWLFKALNQSRTLSGNYNALMPKSEWNISAVWLLSHFRLGTFWAVLHYMSSWDWVGMYFKMVGMDPNRCTVSCLHLPTTTISLYSTHRTFCTKKENLIYIE